MPNINLAFCHAPLGYMWKKETSTMRLSQVGDEVSMINPMTGHNVGKARIVATKCTGLNTLRSGLCIGYKEIVTYEMVSVSSH